MSNICAVALLLRSNQCGVSKTPQLGHIAATQRQREFTHVSAGAPESVRSWRSCLWRFGGRIAAIVARSQQRSA